MAFSYGAFWRLLQEVDGRHQNLRTVLSGNKGNTANETAQGIGRTFELAVALIMLETEKKPLPHASYK